MRQTDIHKLIEGYFEASLSEQEETELRSLLCKTDNDSDDIREAKATMGIFATERKLTFKHVGNHKHKSLWGKMKYAAVFILGAFLDIAFDDDINLDSK